MSADEHARRLDDIEKRLAEIEKSIWPFATAYAANEKLHRMYGSAYKQFAQWCNCGRDVCRAPDCPIHKADPLGR
jgi:hypothetical protein